MFAVCNLDTKQVVEICSVLREESRMKFIEVPEEHEVARHPTWYQLNIAQVGIEINISAMKEEKIAQLSKETTLFIESHYPPQRQITLTIMLIDAATTQPPLLNRMNYIKAGLSWGFIVLSWYYQHKAAISSMSTKQSILSYEWNFSTLPDDPQASIENAMAMIN